MSTSISTYSGYNYITNTQRLSSETRTKIFANNGYISDAVENRKQIVIEACKDEIADILQYDDPYTEARHRYEDTAAGRAHLSNLISLIRGGGTSMSSICFLDPVLDGTAYISTAEEYLEKSYNRQMINKQLNNIFSKAGIDVPSNTTFVFSVDVNNYITVTGGSKELNQSMEKALNQGDNGSQLGHHWKDCLSTSEIIKGQDSIKYRQYLKFIMNDLFKKYVGYGFGDFTRDENGKFLLPDGRNAWKTFIKATDAALANDPLFEAGSFAKSYDNMFHHIENNSDDYYPDYNLTFEYRNGSLYDIGQEEQYGDGQTNWIDKVVANDAKHIFCSEEVWGEKFEFKEHDYSYDEKIATNKTYMQEQHQENTASLLQQILQEYNISLADNSKFVLGLNSSGKLFAFGSADNQAITFALNNSSQGNKLLFEIIYSLDDERREALMSSMHKCFTADQILKYTGKDIKEQQDKKDNSTTADELYESYKEALLANSTVVHPYLYLAYVKEGLKMIEESGYQETSVQVTYNNGQLITGVQNLNIEA